MSRFKINDVFITKNDFDYAAQLKTAYIGKITPLCMCLPSGIPMYIAHASAEYIIKRMPNSGSDHHIDCESYEIPSSLSGRGDLRNGAIAEDRDTGITKLRLDFALTKNNTSRLAPAGECGQKTTIQSTPSKLSLRSLLHYLYEEAGLNKWFPRMEGKRNWYVVRKFLLNEIQNKQAKNAPLSKAIFIPEVFSVDNKDQINKRIQQYMASLKPEGKKQPVSILIGEVKKIEKARFEHRLIVKHMPETPFYLGEDVYRRIYRNFGFEMALFEQQESIHLLTICTFFLTGC